MHPFIHNVKGFYITRNEGEMSELHRFFQHLHMRSHSLYVNIRFCLKVEMVLTFPHEKNPALFFDYSYLISILTKISHFHMVYF